MPISRIGRHGDDKNALLASEKWYTNPANVVLDESTIAEGRATGSIFQVFWHAPERRYWF